MLLQKLFRNQHQRGPAIGDLRAVRYLQWRRDARVLLRDLRRVIIGQIGIAHLGERIQAGVRVIFVGDPVEGVAGSSVFLHVNLRDFPEQLREHEVAVLRSFEMVIRRRAEDIASIEGGHRLLLFRADNQDGIVKSAHDPLRAEDDRKRAARARRFGMHRRDPVQRRVDLRHKRTEVQLLGELAGVEIAHCRCFDFRRIDLGIVDRFPT